MSALARYFKGKGYAVAGYDKTPSDLTAALEREGIAVHYEDRPDLVPASVEDTLVIYTPAIHELRELDLVKRKATTWSSARSPWARSPRASAASPSPARTARRRHRP